MARSDEGNKPPEAKAADPLEDLTGPLGPARGLADLSSNISMSDNARLLARLQRGRVAAAESAKLTLSADIREKIARKQELYKQSAALAIENDLIDQELLKVAVDSELIDISGFTDLLCW